MNAAGFFNQLISALNLLGFLGCQFNHIRGHALSHQFVGVVGAHQFAIGALDLRVAGALAHAERAIGLRQLILALAGVELGMRLRVGIRITLLIAALISAILIARLVE